LPFGQSPARFASAAKALWLQQAPAILSVTTKDGRRIVEEVLINRGGLERPLSDDELAVKFSENCRCALAPETTEALRLSLDRMAEAMPICRMRSGCCARAASGHAIATPPSSVINSRRPMKKVI
jgi:hypothetical protein